MNRHLAVALIRLTLTVAFVFVMFDVLQTTWRSASRPTPWPR